MEVDQRITSLTKEGHNLRRARRWSTKTLGLDLMDK